MQYTWIFLTLFICLTVTTSGCYLPTKQDGANQIHVIHLGASDDENSFQEENEPEMIEIHLPADMRRKRQVDSSENAKSCKTDAECPEGWHCDQLLICHPASTSEDGPQKTKNYTNETENALEEAPHPTHSIVSISISTTYEP